jgi:hypothetical protein
MRSRTEVDNHNPVDMVFSIGALTTLTGNRIGITDFKPNRVVAGISLSTAARRPSAVAKACEPAPV